MIDTSADDAYILSDWGESLTLINRKTTAETAFTGVLNEINTDSDTFECAITATASAISAIKKEDLVKRNSNNKIYLIYDIDKQGNLTYLRGQLKERDFLGSL